MANILYDGHRKTNINNLPEEAWEYLRGEGEDSGLKLLQKKVPWLYRGLEYRANGVASVPFAIYKGDAEFDTSEDWQNKIEIMPDPWTLLRKLEKSMTLFNYGYLAQPKNPYGIAKELRYLVPSTMKPIITEDGGLTHFERKLRGKTIEMGIDEVVYFWGDDPYTEIGHPQSSPATAAMAAAGVLMNVDEFAAAFFERGAIKATILAVPQGTQKDERDALSKWYSGIMTGISNAFSTKVLNADAVTATVIGEGLEGLENTTLSKDKKEDISTALGIALSKMFPTTATDSNRAEDEKSYLNDTIVPQTRFYEGILNKQVFDDLGLKWKFQPQQMDLFQEDEQKRADAFSKYVAAVGRDKASIIAEMLGLELPDQYDYPDLDSEPIEQMPITVPQNNDKKEDERGKFHRFMKRQPENIDKFEFNFIDEIEQKALKAEYAVSEHDILLKSLTDSLDAVRNDFKENTVNVFNEISTPEQKAPDVNVTTPEVVVNTPEVKNIVNVDVPEPNTVINVQPSDVVIENKVDVPDVKIENIIELPERKPRKTKVKRDSYGNIIEMDTD